MKKHLLIRLFLLVTLISLKNPLVYGQYCSVDPYGCGNLKADQILSMTVKLGATEVYSNEISGIGATCRSDGGVDGYSDFTSTIINLNPGNSYTMILKRNEIADNSNNKMVFWIDFNQNNILDDLDEEFKALPEGAGSDLFTLDFTVPLTATLGNTRLRLRVIYSEDTPSPCDGGLETEDYTINIVPNCPTITFTSTPSSVSCNGGTNGKITISGISAGTAPFKYSINAGTFINLAANGEITGLNANTYQVKIKDAGDCESDVVSVIVEQPSIVTITAGTKTNPNNCGANDGNIPFTTNLANGNYTFTYTRSGVSESRSVIVNGGAFTLPNLLAGSYKDFNIVTSSGCTGVDGTTVVLQNPLVTLVVGTVNHLTRCNINDGSIQFSTNLPNGTYALTFNGVGSPQNVNVVGGSFRLENLRKGEYRDFYITKNADCIGNDNSRIVLTEPVLPLAPTSGSFFPDSYCPSLPVIDLKNNVSCGVGKTVIWYLEPTGGLVVVEPTKTLNKSIDFYIACRDDITNCESTERYKLSFTALTVGKTLVNATITADGTTINAGEPAVSICDLPGNVLEFAPNCGAGEIKLYSVDGVDFNATLPTQIVDGAIHNYRVRCQAGTGAEACLGPVSDIMSLRIYPKLPTPLVSLSPTVLCEEEPEQTLTGISSCGTAATLWFDALTNTPLATLPPITPKNSRSFYAKCLGEGGCLSEASNIVSITILKSIAPPVIINTKSDEICVGTQVTLTTNCPLGSTVVWNDTYINPELNITWLTPHIETVNAKCVFSKGCSTPYGSKRLIWKILDVTVINLGASGSATKPGEHVPIEAWSNQFITSDAGPTLEESTPTNPATYYTENVNKGAPRYWTVHVDACKQPLGGSVSYDLLCQPEFGPEISFNTHENNAPYLMFANRDNFTELYSLNNPFFGFYEKDATGNNRFDSGFPKGLYKMGIRYWDQQGVGVAPAVRKAVGRVLLYKEYWFRIISKLGVGSGAPREGVKEDLGEYFAIVMPNPVTKTFTLLMNGAKDKRVQLRLVSISGHTIFNKVVMPISNSHKEEFDISSQKSGLYLLQVDNGEKKTTLKIVKVPQD